MSRPEPQYLFVYGTLRQATRHPMSRLLQRHARRIGPARFQGRLYRVGWYPGARDAQQSGETIVGELYALERPGGCLAALDAYEGSDFQRVERPIACRHRRYRAWIYLYTGATRGLPRIPGGDFLERIGRTAHTR